MARKKTIHDKNQPLLPGFEAAGKQAVGGIYNELKKVDRALREIIETRPQRCGVEDEYEVCQEIGIALKQEIRESGLSRQEFAEEVNAFFGRTEQRHKLGECRKPLTDTDVDKIISDTANRPLHAYYLFAFSHILGFGMLNVIAAARGGQVVSQEDRRLMALAQIGELKVKIRDAEKTLKG